MENTNNILSFKNRKVDSTKPIKIYRNLNKPDVIYSVKQFGLVVGYASQINLKDCTCKINYKAQLRIRNTSIREVHAFVEGYITNDNLPTQVHLNYNPFSYRHFFTIDGYCHPIKIIGATFASFGPTGVRVFPIYEN